MISDKVTKITITFELTVDELFALADAGGYDATRTAATRRKEAITQIRAAVNGLVDTELEKWTAKTTAQREHLLASLRKETE